jgi:hypothetical protein
MDGSRVCYTGIFYWIKSVLRADGAALPWIVATILALLAFAIADPFIQFLIISKYVLRRVVQSVLANSAFAPRVVAAVLALPVVCVWFVDGSFADGTIFRQIENWRRAGSAVAARVVNSWIATNIFLAAI